MNETENKDQTNQVQVDQHAQMTQLLDAQEERRIKMKYQKARIDEETKNPEEKMVVIESTFSSHHESLHGEIKKLQSLKTLDRETVNVLWDSLADIREYFTQVSFSMNSYNQWKFKKRIQDLETLIQELAKKIPRKKFRFRRVAKKVANNEDLEKELRKKEELEKVQHTAIIDSLQGITNRRNEDIVVPENELDNIGNYKLVNLENCTVKLQGNVNMLFIRNVKNCQIWTCPVANSIMIHDAVNSHLRIIGHQIRMHDSFDTRFDVYTTSKLIIEGCKRLEFSEWLTDRKFIKDDGYGSTNYANFDRHFEISGLNKIENLWREVQDFHWIKQEKSPNFVLLEKDVSEDKNLFQDQAVDVDQTENLDDEDEI